MEIINEFNNRSNIDFLHKVQANVSIKLQEMIELVHVNSNLYQVWANWLNIRYKATIIYIIIEEIKGKINPELSSQKNIQSLLNYSHSSNILQWDIMEIIRKAIATNVNFKQHVEQHIKHFEKNNIPPYAGLTLSLNKLEFYDIREVSQIEGNNVILYTITIIEMMEKWIDNLMRIKTYYF